MFPVAAQNLACTLSGQLILERVDLSIQAGEVVALIGANGTGKSTLLRCLAGVLRPTAGQVLWFGVSPARRPERHRLLGFVAHESCVYPELSSRENLLFAARMHGLKSPQERAEEQLAACGLVGHAHLPAHRLSRGQRQRLAIARALIHDPPIVILDEPFTGLDSDGRCWLEQSLLKLRETGRAVCLTGHDEETYRRIANRHLELRCGTCMAAPNRARGPRCI